MNINKPSIFRPKQTFSQFYLHAQAIDFKFFIIVHRNSGEDFDYDYADGEYVETPRLTFTLKSIRKLLSFSWVNLDFAGILKYFRSFVFVRWCWEWYVCVVPVKTRSERNQFQISELRLTINNIYINANILGFNVVMY